MQNKPVKACDVAVVSGQTVYPAEFAHVVAGRSKRKLGDLFGLANFGVNLTTLAPGAASALFHCHAIQDEFVFVLEGTPTLLFGDQEFTLTPGDCMGFRAGAGLGHQLVNRTAASVTYLELGDRTPGEQVTYPRDDIAAQHLPDGSWCMTRKDGTPF